MSDVRPADEKVIPPSYFAGLGQPMCSRWGKSEIEWIALAYVQALANDGDTWKPLSREQVLRLMPDEGKGYVRSLLDCDPDRFEHCKTYVYWFELVSNQLSDAEGAFGVRGFWNRRPE